MQMGVEMSWVGIDILERYKVFCAVRVERKLSVRQLRDWDHWRPRLFGLFAFPCSCRGVSGKKVTRNNAHHVG